jgi:hypothetical protein
MERGGARRGMGHRIARLADLSVLPHAEDESWAHSSGQDDSSVQRGSGALSISSSPRLGAGVVMD